MVHWLGNPGRENKTKKKSQSEGEETLMACERQLPAVRVAMGMVEEDSKGIINLQKQMCRVKNKEARIT